MRSSHYSTESTTCLVDVIPSGSGEIPLLPEPMSFDLHFEATLDDRVSGQFGERTLRKFIDLIDKTQRETKPRFFTNSRVPRRCTLPKEVPDQPIDFRDTFDYSPRCLTFVKWNCNGSSVLKLTFNPTLKKSGNGLRSYVRNRLLLLRGLIATPICLR